MIDPDVAAALADVALVEEGLARGFIPRTRTRRVECDWLEPEDGHSRLWAVVRCDLPLGVIEELPFGGGHTYAEVWKAIYPYVLDWNALGWDEATDARVALPPPAQGGPDAFKWVDPIVSDWLAFVLKTTYRNLVSDDQKKGSSGGPSSPSEPASDSSSPANASPPSRKGSRSPSAST